MGKKPTVDGATDAAARSPSPADD